MDISGVESQKTMNCQFLSGLGARGGLLLLIALWGVFSSIRANAQDLNNIESSISKYDTAQQSQPSDRFLQPDAQPLTPLPEETKPLLSPTPAEASPSIPEPDASDVTISVTRIDVMGSTVFDPQQFTPILEPLEGQVVSLSELQNAADKITELYVTEGYLTSRAILAEQDIVDGIVQIQVIEGRLQEDGIQIEGDERLGNYVRSRLALGTTVPLKADHIEDQLLLLRADPLVETINASLQPSKKMGGERFAGNAQRS